MKFVLASHNKGKLAEMQKILGELGVEVVLQSELGLDLEPEETGDAGEQILELIRKKYLKNLTDRKGIEKTVAALYRRGYPPEEIRAGIRRILEEQPQALQEEMYCDD